MVGGAGFEPATFNRFGVMRVFVTKNRNRIVVVKGNQVREWGIVVDMRTREVKAIEIGNNNESRIHFTQAMGSLCTKN